MRALPVSACLLLALTTGCADKDDEPTTAPAGDPPTTQHSATPSTPDTPTPSTGESETASDLPLLDRLLPTDRVPGLGDAWNWQDGETGPAGTDLFGVCAKADLGSIGAVAAVERTYFPPDDSDDNAAHQVAEFPDQATAARAWSVLQAWHDTCRKKRADHPGLKVRPLQPVDASVGQARWYLVSWAPAGEETGRFEALGMALAGTRLAVVRMDSSGQDYDYPPGGEPVVGMVLGAAALLD